MIEAARLSVVEMFHPQGSGRGVQEQKEEEESRTDKRLKQPDRSEILYQSVLIRIQQLQNLSAFNRIFPLFGSYDPKRSSDPHYPDLMERTSLIAISKGYPTSNTETSSSDATTSKLRDVAPSQALSWDIQRFQVANMIYFDAQSSRTVRSTYLRSVATNLMRSQEAIREYLSTENIRIWMRDLKKLFHDDGTLLDSMNSTVDGKTEGQKLEELQEVLREAGRTVKSVLKELKRWDDRFYKKLKESAEEESQRLRLCLVQRMSRRREQIVICLIQLVYEFLSGDLLVDEQEEEEEQENERGETEWVVAGEERKQRGRPKRARARGFDDICDWLQKHVSESESGLISDDRAVPLEVFQALIKPFVIWCFHDYNRDVRNAERAMAKTDVDLGIEDPGNNNSNNTFVIIAKMQEFLKHGMERIGSVDALDSSSSSSDLSGLTGLLSRIPSQLDGFGTPCVYLGHFFVDLAKDWTLFFDTQTHWNTSNKDGSLRIMSISDRYSSALRVMCREVHEQLKTLSSERKFIGTLTGWVQMLLKVEFVQEWNLAFSK